MNDFNIEFAHIYSDQEFGVEQLKSIKKLRKVVNDLKKENKSFVTTVLIDEYSPAVSTLDENNFLDEIKKNKGMIDFVAYESELCGIAQGVIELIPQDHLKTQKFHERDVLLLVKDGKRIGLKENSGKYSCSLLIASWILVRFGIYSLPSVKNLSGKDFAAKELITILPRKYRETEQKVLDILECTKHRDLIKKIRYEFF